MSNPKFTTFVMHIVLLVVFLGLIRMIFDLHRFAFIGNFLVLLGLIGIAFIAAIGINNNHKWAWILLTLVFVGIFLDMVFVYVLSASKPGLFSTLLIATVAGFFISLLSIENPKAEEEVKKTFKPGKYIASKTGSKYHAPKCDWAKKIKKKNAVWFNNKQDAKKADYKADSCVK